MLALYRKLTQWAAPLLKYHLARRLKRGKEDPTRIYERFGGASLNRPRGELIWFHAASVGESISILSLLERLRKERPETSILLTTGTVTSGILMGEKLAEGMIHQYIPLDVPKWVGRFLDHWKPDLAVFVESEFWPNFLHGIKERNIPLVLLNARISNKSFHRWIRLKKFAREIFEKFDLCLTPNMDTAKRLKDLGAKYVSLTANLKFTADPLAFDEKELKHLVSKTKGRPIWTAASTHEGEEEFALNAHDEIAKKYPNVLTILVPRHPMRGDKIEALIRERGLTVARRSRGDKVESHTNVWLVDTIGELGLIYSLARVSFVGGSFVPIGGHNPIEAVNCGTIVINGPHTENFMDINQILGSAMIQIEEPARLGSEILGLFENKAKSDKLIHQGQEILKQQQTGLGKILKQILEEMP